MEQTPNYETEKGTRRTDIHGDVVIQSLEHQDYASPTAEAFQDEELKRRIALAKKYAEKSR